METKNLVLTAIYLVAVLSANIFAQENVQIGKSFKGNISSNGALYDYSDPDGINIKVMVWGYVKYPGQYIISSSNGVNELLSLAGGPTQDADVDDLKLFRINPDSSQTIINFNYSNLLWNNGGLSKPLIIPGLHPGDILLIPGSPKWFLKDYMGLVFTIVSTLASLATLLVYLYK
jgi:protein involved in polysaccharide export with SLBB domain